MNCYELLFSTRSQHQLQKLLQQQKEARQVKEEETK
jgi:hypothetical protein